MEGISPPYAWERSSSCLPLRSVALFRTCPGKDAHAPRHGTGKFDSVVRGTISGVFHYMVLTDGGVLCAAYWISSITPHAIRGPPDPPGTPVVP